VIGCELDAADPYGSIAAIDQRMDKAVAHNWFAKSAIEMACWDAMGHAAGKPVYDLLGGACRSRVVPSRFSMGAYDLPRARARAAELVAQGFTTVKVKVGGKAEDDIARVRAVREVIGPERALVIDANTGWTAETAIHCLNELRDCNIAVMEQPTADGDYAAMMKVRHACILQVRTGAPIKVMADDMCFNLIHAVQLIAHDACDLISVYPGKNGGIRKSREIVEYAGKCGVGCSIGSNLEFDIATAAMGHLVIATPNLLVEQYPGDIYGPVYYETRIVKNPLIIKGPTITIPDAPGLGVEVDWDLVRELRCVD
jgi:muconate cycloisomerase